MKNRTIERLRGFRAKIGKGGRFTSHHAVLILEIAEQHQADIISLEKQLVMAVSAGEISAKACSEANIACNNLRSEHVAAINIATGDAEKANRKRLSESQDKEKSIADAESRLERLLGQLEKSSSDHAQTVSLLREANNEIGQLRHALGGAGARKQEVQAEKDNTENKEVTGDNSGPPNERPGSLEGGN